MPCTTDWMWTCKVYVKSMVRTDFLKSLQWTLLASGARPSAPTNEAFLDEAARGGLSTWPVDHLP